jgi:hypothetical protein
VSAIQREISPIEISPRSRPSLSTGRCRQRRSANITIVCSTVASGGNSHHVGRHDVGDPFRFRIDALADEDAADAVPVNFRNRFGDGSDDATVCSAGLLRSRSADNGVFIG